MKKLFSSILICIILILFLLTGCSTQITNIPSTITSISKYPVNFPKAAGKVPDVTFEETIAQPDFPDELAVYKMVKPEITAEYVASLGAKFGLTGDVGQGTGGYSIHDNDTDAHLGVYMPTGTIRYTVDSKLYPKEKPVLPSNEEAKQIALNFLVERGLLPEGDAVAEVRIGGSSSGYGPAHLLVSFTHTVNIDGPGARHGVRIGDGGEVIDVFINPINPLTMPVQEMMSRKSITEALEALQVSKNYIVPVGARKVTVSDVKIVYWLEPIDKGQEYIAPVYVFVGQCFDNADKLLEGGFRGYTEAIN